jgi:hypothetical protein
MEKIIEAVKVKPKEKYILEVEFSDGVIKLIDFKPFIKNGVSKQLENKALFNTVKVDYGTLVWENGYDVCPVFLRQEL